MGLIAGAIFLVLLVIFLAWIALRLDRGTLTPALRALVFRTLVILLAVVAWGMLVWVGFSGTDSSGWGPDDTGTTVSNAPGGGS